MPMHASNCSCNINVLVLVSIIWLQQKAKHHYSTTAANGYSTGERHRRPAARAYNPESLTMRAAPWRAVVYLPNLQGGLLKDQGALLWQ